MATTITYKGSDLTSFSNTSKTLRTAGKYLEGDITIAASADVNNQNKTVVPSETTQTVTSDTGYTGLGTVTVNGITNIYIGSSVPRCDSDDISTTYDSTTNRIKTSVSTGYYSGNNLTQRPDIILPTQSKTTIIPSETDQTAVDQYKWTTGTVTVAAITSTYVGSSITRPGSSGISNSITNGYYKISVSPGYYPGTANKSLGLENPTIIPSETQQVKRPTSNNYYIESVTVAAITPTYVGSEVPTGSLTVSGPTVTASAGYYANAVTETIARGVTQNITISEFTPGITINNSGLISTTGGGTKSKQEPPVIGTGAGYVDSTDRIEASIRITNATYQLPTLPAQTFTPSSTTQTVTSTGKYILGDITVEPIPSQYIVPSGTLTINTNGTNDVTQYASVEVNVPSNTPTLQAKSAVPSTSTTLTITADNGYDGLSSVIVAAITTTSQAIPQVSINSETGLITATATQSEGYVEADTKRGTLQLTTKATTTYSPSTSDQYIQAGTYLTGLVTIEGMTNGDNLTYGTTTTVTEALVTKSLLDALATTIKNKATSSTLPMTISAMQTAVQSIRTSSQISLQSKTVSPNGSTVVITPDSGYDGLASVQVNAVNATELNVSSNGTYTPASGQYYNRIVVNTDTSTEFNLQTKEVTPSGSPQSVTPDTGYQGLSSVTVKAIPSSYANITNINATVADVTSGKTFVDNTGAEKTGTLQVNSYYVRSTTPDSTLGSDGDLCLKI